MQRDLNELLARWTAVCPDECRADETDNTWTVLVEDSEWWVHEDGFDYHGNSARLLGAVVYHTARRQWNATLTLDSAHVALADGQAAGGASVRNPYRHRMGEVYMVEHVPVDSALAGFRAVAVAALDSYLTSIEADAEARDA